ncbi:MAG TPA: hypothetical protein VMG09_03275 [Bacteroidota bacterium]|nr:hypothetical protein [Bacteroidota bacterium]
MSTVLVHNGLLVILIGAYFAHTSLFYRRLKGRAPNQEQTGFDRPKGSESLSTNPRRVRSHEQ